MLAAKRPPAAGAAAEEGPEEGEFRVPVGLVLAQVKAFCGGAHQLRYVSQQCLVLTGGGSRRGGWGRCGEVEALRHELSGVGVKGRGAGVHRARPSLLARAKGRV